MEKMVPFKKLLLEVSNFKNTKELTYMLIFIKMCEFILFCLNQSDSSNISDIKNIGDYLDNILSLTNEL